MRCACASGAEMAEQESDANASSRCQTSRDRRRVAINPPSVQQLREESELPERHLVRPPESLRHSEEEDLSLDFSSFDFSSSHDQPHTRDSSPHLDRAQGNPTCHAPSTYGFDSQQIYLRPERYKYEEMASFQERLRTFEKWPLQFPRGMDLAAADMFYEGVRVHNGETIIDQVICCKCGLSIRGWLPEDNPVEEHRKLFLGCFHTKWVEEL